MNITDVNKSVLDNQGMGGHSAYILTFAIAFGLGGAISLVLWLLPPATWFSGPPERCPNCLSKDFRTSMVSSIVDHIRTAFHLRPYRCRGCWSRFLAKAIDEKSHGIVGGQTSRG
jgi:hypothetical protein